ncbi:unnamed protein product [Rhizoctonia solani]|uniref:N-acetyltransferase domain-containing protein n=1 Tax=Rhizoctonia solani TaxID=456999 RepID=A0A8H3D459_9AGAM|nr:unnamed protein product [Rhizoctonia solani]CAE6509672.1 unnamed protein product [Rhizoctonia solani]
MSTRTQGPKELEIALLQSHGGIIPYEHFYELIDQLQKAGSLDHVSPIPSSLGEFDVLYLILRKGYRCNFDEAGNQIYVHITDADENSYWLAGFAYLGFPAYRHRWESATKSGNHTMGDTGDISISLLPAAQKQGYGRFVVQRLIKHAFDTLRIPRVTASVICPVQPSYSAATKKQVVYNTKRLCWVFEKFGFKFEGVSRGVVPSTRLTDNPEPIWHDVHRMSMLQTDYFEGGRSYLLSHTRPFHDEMTTQKVPESPWESMIHRQEEEKSDMKSWDKKTQTESVNDACESEDNDGNDSDGTVLGDNTGSDEDWDMASDHDD